MGGPIAVVPRRRASSGGGDGDSGKGVSKNRKSRRGGKSAALNDRSRQRQGQDVLDDWDDYDREKAGDGGMRLGSKALLGVAASTTLAHLPWLEWHFDNDWEAASVGNDGTDHLNRVPSGVLQPQFIALAVHICLCCAILKSQLKFAFRTGRENSNHVDFALQDACENHRDLDKTRQIGITIETFVRIFSVGAAANLPGCVSGIIGCEPIDLVCILQVFLALDSYATRLSFEMAVFGSMNFAALYFVKPAQSLAWGETSSDMRPMSEWGAAYLISIFGGVCLFQSAIYYFLERNQGRVAIELVHSIRRAEKLGGIRTIHFIAQNVRLCGSALLLAGVFAFILLTAQEIVRSSDKRTCASLSLLSAEAKLAKYLGEPILIEGGRAVFSQGDLVAGDKTIADTSIELRRVASAIVALTARQNSTFCMLQATVLMAKQKFEPALSCLGCAASSFSSSTRLIDPKDCYATALDSTHDGYKAALSEARGSIVKSVEPPILMQDNLERALNAVRAAKSQAKSVLKWASQSRNTCIAAKKALDGGRGQSAKTLLRAAEMAHLALSVLGFSRLALWCEDAIASSMSESFPIAPTPVRERAMAIFEQVVIVERTNQELYWDAFTALNAAVAENATFAKGWFRLGWVQSSLGEQEKSLESFRTARKLEPDNFEVVRHLGLHLGRMGSYVESVSMMHEALALAEQKQKDGARDKISVVRERMDILADLCRIHLDAGMLRKALECTLPNETTESFFQEEHAPVFFFTTRGIVQIRFGQDDAGLASFIKALEQAEHWRVKIEQLNGRAKEHSAAHEPDHAAAGIRLVLQNEKGGPQYSKSQHADAHNNVGIMLFNRQDFNGARRHFEQALTLSPGHKTASDNLEAVSRSTRSIPKA